jgi:TolB-like protein
MFFWAIMSFSFGISAQSNMTIAILDLENKAHLKETTLTRVWDKIAKEFSSKKEYIVYERWMVDTLIAEQSNVKMLACRDEQCLFAIGHLLSVNFVLSGSISVRNDAYLVSLQLIDIKNNVSAGLLEKPIPDFYEATLTRDIPKMTNELLVAIQKQDRNLSKTAVVEPEKNLSSSSSTELSSEVPEKKVHRSFLSKPGFLIPLSAVLAGGAVAGYLFLKSEKTGNEGPTDVPLTDAPSHSRITR